MIIATILILAVVITIIAEELMRSGFTLRPHRYPDAITEDEARKNSEPLTSAIMNRATPIKKEQP